MSITLEAVVNSAGATASVTTFTTDVPSGTVDGDLLLWSLVANTATVASTPDGWNIWKVSTTTALNLSTFWRVASGEGASHTHSSLTSARWGGAMLRFSGVDHTHPADVAFPTRVAGTSGQGWPALTPVTPGAVIVAMSACIGPSGTVDCTYTAGNLDSLATDFGSNVAAASNAFGCHGLEAWTSGAFTPTGPIDNVISTRTIGDTTALRPAQPPILLMPPRN